MPKVTGTNLISLGEENMEYQHLSSCLKIYNQLWMDIPGDDEYDRKQSAHSELT